jgi:hypothetical protein
MEKLESIAAVLDLQHTISEAHAVPLEATPDARDTPRLYLVELWRPLIDVVPLRIVYGPSTFGVDGAPRLSDVLFYLASQSAQMDRCCGRLELWLPIAGIDVVNGAAVALFSERQRLHRHLRALLGESGYELLMRFYRAEVGDEA